MSLIQNQPTSRMSPEVRELPRHFFRPLERGVLIRGSWVAQEKGGVDPGLHKVFCVRPRRAYYHSSHNPSLLGLNLLSPSNFPVGRDAVSFQAQGKKWVCKHLASSALEGSSLLPSPRRIGPWCFGMTVDRWASGPPLGNLSVRHVAWKEM